MSASYEASRAPIDWSRLVGPAITVLLIGGGGAMSYAALAERLYALERQVQERRSDMAVILERLDDSRERLIRLEEKISVMQSSVEDASTP